MSDFNPINAAQTSADDDTSTSSDAAVCGW